MKMKKLISFLLTITIAFSFNAYSDKAYASDHTDIVIKSQMKYPEKARNGFISEDGYVLYYINGDLKQIEFKYAIDAKITVDESKAVLLDSFGSLVYYDFSSDIAEAKEISSLATEIVEVKNDGVLYSINNGDTTELYYYSFQLDNSIEISENIGALDDIIISIGNDLHVVYADDYYIYQIESTFDEPKIIGRYQNVIFLTEISQDGSKIIWTDAGVESEEVFMYEDNEATRVCTYEPSVRNENNTNYISSQTKAEFNYSGKYCIISNTNSEIVYLKVDDCEDAEIYHLRSNCSENWAYTENGPFRYDCSEVIQSFYIQGGFDLYICIADGEYDRIATGCINYAISNGYLYYTTNGKGTQKYNLYSAKISGDRITDDRCYASDSGLWWFLPIGDYVYWGYTADNQYVPNWIVVNKALVSAKDDDKLVDFPIDKLFISTDGSASYYSENNKFYRYSYESRERVEISRDVEFVSSRYVEYPVYLLSSSSRIKSIIILDNDFIYGKYKYSASGAKYYDFYYFDGDNSEKILSGSPVYR